MKIPQKIKDKVIDVTMFGVAFLGLIILSCFIFLLMYVLACCMLGIDPY